MPDLEAEIAYHLGLEITRELLLKEDPLITEDYVEEIWNACNGNAWNAHIIYHLWKESK